jgi:exoribonuclease R
VHGADARGLQAGVRALEREMGLIADFPPEVQAEAETASERPTLPDLDRTDIPFVTVDPEGARDLDQAVHIERSGNGYVVHYAIADVAAFVEPGGAVDREAQRRGETLYGADSKIPLHPPVLSEGAASLLPDQVRPALLWTIEVDADGESREADVRRALVRSRAQLTYAQVQKRLDAGTEEEVFTLLREVGALRVERERARGGINLPLPEQEVVVDGGRWSLRFRAPLPVEEWNAQISLLTGMAAAGLMMHAEVGILRTLPEADPEVVQRLHRTAKGLGIRWPSEQPYPDFIRGLDPHLPHHAAMVDASTALLRGSGYAGFDGTVPEQSAHAALAAEYTHVTAPLRRLVDRYAGEVCVSLCADREVPEWVRAMLPELPRLMEESGRRANQYEGAILDLVESGVLAHLVGETFTGVIVDLDHDDPARGSVVVREPAVEAPVQGSAPLPLGQEVPVRLVEADMSSRSVRFEPVTG